MKRSRSWAIGDTEAEELFRIAIDTRDSGIRYEIFVLLVRAADPAFQTRLFELAVNPGRVSMKAIAAACLVAGHEHVTSDVVGRITPQLLETRTESVASRLLLLLP